MPADFFPEVQTKVPSIETTPRPNNKDDAPAQARPSLGPVSQSSSFAAVATEGIKTTTAIVDDVTAVLPALETRDDDIVTTTAEEKDDDGGHDIKREAVTTAKENGDGSDAVAQQAVELEPAALIAEEAAVPVDEKSALKKSVIVVSSSARGLEPTSSNVGEATPILPTTTVQKEAFPMPTSLPPDDLGRRRFGKINQKVFLLLCYFG